MLEVAANGHDATTRYVAMHCPHQQNWTHDLQLADIPPYQSATPGIRPTAHKLLGISHPTEGRRLSWSEDTAG